MKNRKILFFFSLIVLSCSDKEEEAIVDCFGQSILIDVQHETVDTNPFQVNYNVSYAGHHTIDKSIRWDFGDGSVQTTDGKTSSHTYAKTGTYTVTAKVGLNNGGCSFDVKETVIIK
ncbi:PKD domain-containing protein [Sphingobacterium spiritivorum]|uniref:PKD domain-containing protein n=1 Tax=Sphingobacterium spiritivorum TaxID=258 RepID=UPI003DA46CFD